MVNFKKPKTSESLIQQHWDLRGVRPSNGVEIRALDNRFLP